MKYIEWNNLIASYLFRPENAGHYAYIYASKSDIIELGTLIHFDLTEEEIWEDFITKIKFGIHGSPFGTDIITRAIHAFNLGNRSEIKTIEGVDMLYPPYVAYLVFMVLPLIEIQGDYNSNNYYDRLEEFLKLNEIKQDLRGKLRDIDMLWANLAHWANDTHNGELGFFQARNFIHQNWRFVGKLFSQCILPPRALSKMPTMFLEANWIPNSFYSEREFKNILLQFGPRILFLSPGAYDLVNHCDRDELGQSIIETTKKEYNKWTGESNSLPDNGNLESIIRNYTPCRLYLQLEPKINSGRISFSYRLYSKNEYPSDLTIDGLENIYEERGWSRSLAWPFRESFEFRDDLNKWIARFPKKDIRLFKNGASEQFSGDYWLETDFLSRSEWIYILCLKKEKDSVISWGKNNCKYFEDDSDFNGMPEDYCLFKILQPRSSHTNISILTVYTEKSIKFTGGLNLNFRTFISDFLPEIEITNCIGDEIVFLEYKDEGTKIPLNKINSLVTRWALPDSIQFNRDFVIKIDGENLNENELVYRIASSSGSAKRLDGSQLPKRNQFGKIVEDPTGQYCKGSTVLGSDLNKQIPFRHLFRSKREEHLYQLKSVTYNHSRGNALLAYLTAKGISSTEDFYKAFEFYHLNSDNANFQESTNYTKLKKASLNFYDYLGYLDFEYTSKSIVVNPTQLIFIPSSHGRKCLLIGGRDAELMQTLILTASKYNIQVEIIKQVDSNENLLLPDVITVKGYSDEGDKFGERSIAAFAQEIGVDFSADELPQLSLMNFSADINDYENNLLLENETDREDYGWARKKFNAESLQYEWDTSADFDMDFSLLEYKLNEYTFHNRLWLNGKCYSIDKNWGKYIALKNAGKQVILYDEHKHKIVIPFELPLPRLLAEAVMLMSGQAPAFVKIDGRNYRVFDNIPSTIIKNLFDKLSQKVKTFSL